MSRRPLDSLHEVAGRATSRDRHRWHLRLIVPVALVVAACGSDDDPASSDTTAASSTSIAAAELVVVASDTTDGGDEATTDETTTTAPPITTTPSTTTSSTTTSTTASTTTSTTASTSTVVPDAGPCVPGTWELRAQDFFDQIVAIAGDGGGGDMTYLGGRHLAIFNSDGTAEGIREAWSFEVSSPAGSLIVTVDATDSGTWAVDGDTITVSSQEQTFEASYEMMVGGVRQPLPMTPPNTPDAEAFGGAGPYTCVGDVLTITLTEDGITITNTWDRVAG